MANITFNCEKYDTHLHSVMVVVDSSFKVKEIPIKYEEMKTVDNQFFYYIINEKNKLEGYIGRDKNTKKVIYLVKDKGKINWLKKEGFYDNLKNIDDIINNIQIIKKLSNIQSFIEFISGGKDYYFD